MVLCFIFPIAPKLIPFLLVIISIISLFNFKIEKYKELKYYLPFTFSILFYVFCIAGLIWSTDIYSGIKHLEIKLSFLVIPIILLNKNLISENKIIHLLQAFTIGNFIAAIYALTIAAFTYLRDGVNHFTYTLLSPNFHPTYLSIYALFALVLLLNINHLITKSRTLKMIVIIVLVIWILLLSSKINIALLFVLLVIQLTITLKSSKNKLMLLSWSAVLSVLIAAFLFLNTSITERFKASFNAIKHANIIVNKETESNTARILVWKSAIDLVISNPVIGVGTGDVNNELVKEYEKRSYIGIKEKRLNAHNQFLQTALATGIPSALLLFIFLIIPLLLYQNSKYRILHYFIIVFCINGLVESTFENQAGVVFFIFFYFLLLRCISNKIELNNIFR
jgi:O-antigen ligase